MTIRFLKNRYSFVIPKQYTSIDIVATIYLLFYFSIQSYIYTSNPGYIYTIISYLTALLVLFALIMSKNFKINWSILVISFMFFIVLSTMVIGRQNIGIGNMLSVVSGASIAALILRTNVIPQILYLWVIVVSVYYLYNILGGFPVNEYQAAGSRNTISIHLLFVVSTFYIVMLKQQRSIPMLPACILLVTSILVLGRGGIITSLILVIALILYRFHNSSTLQKWFTIFGVISIALLLASNASFLSRFGEIINAEDIYWNFSSRSQFLSGRDVVYAAFFENISFKSFFFGEDISTSLVGSSLSENANTHNSFLGLWQFTGIWAVFIFLYFVYVNFVHLINRPLLGVVMFIIFLRLLTEHIFWFSNFDYLFFLFVFFPLVNAKQN